MANQFYLDASALAKRYVVEPGTPLLNHLFGQVARDRLMCLGLGTLEVVSIFVRKRNGNRISGSVFQRALTTFQREVVNPRDFLEVSMTDTLVRASWPMVLRYSVNSTDAVVLRSALDLQAQSIVTGGTVVLIAADQRLLRAALAEGLTTFNPETQSQADLDVLIGP